MPRLSTISAALALTLPFLIGCSDDGAPARAEWEDIAGFPEDPGYLATIWGSGPDDVFVAGGKGSGRVYHYDGASWEAMGVPEGTGLLIWLFGFGPDDVYAVGIAGSVIHYDGSSWQALDSGTDEDLWGVWGSSASDIWIVGGSVSSSDFVILHYDGSEFERVTVDPSENPNGSRSLFKVWGVGDKTFAVGNAGLILEYDGSEWRRVPAGEDASQDFVSLWGTSEEDILVVGGRATSQIARYNGSTFDTVNHTDFGGTSAVHMLDSGEAIVGGLPGYIGTFDVADSSLTLDVLTEHEVHATWQDGAGTAYAVGGLPVAPYLDVAMWKRSGG